MHLPRSALATPGSATPTLLGAPLGPTVTTTRAAPGYRGQHFSARVLAQRSSSARALRSMGALPPAFPAVAACGRQLSIGSSCAAEIDDVDVANGTGATA